VTARHDTHEPRQGVALSVVVPAHNSAHFIEATLRQLAVRLANRSAEIIVVENGSSDHTLLRCERLAAGWPPGSVALRVLSSAKGMGYALRTGVEASRGDAVLLTADDLPFGFDDLDAADRIGQAGGPVPPVIIGSKSHPDSSVERAATRGVLTSGFGLLRRLILGTHVGDSQGTFLVDGDLLRRVVPDLHEHGFLFTTELACVVERMGIRPVEVPIRLRHNHGDHESRISLADVASMGVGLLRIRLRHRAGGLEHSSVSRPSSAP
jgi:dolichyl-phosphate beta-glucosyltransferase